MSRTAHVTLETRIEQAIAFGRSRRWMLTHLPCTEDDIADAYVRLNAAADTDPAAWSRVVKWTSGRLDEHLIERIAHGTYRVPLHQTSPELVEAVRQLAGQGMNDTEIGHRVGRTHAAITALRKRRSIPAGAPATPDDMSWHKIWKPHHRRVGRSA